MKKNFIPAAAVLMVFLLSSCVYYVDRPDVYTNQAPPESYFYSYSPANAMAYSYQTGATPVNFLILKVYDNRYIFYDNNNTEIANWIFQPNGTVIKRGRMIDGLVTVFYGPGRPAAEIMYKNNERDGFSRFYYANGKPMEFGDYAKGVKSGDWKKFNEEGALNEEFVINNGKTSYKLKPKNPEKKEINRDFDYLEREHEFKKEVKQAFDKKDIYPEKYKKAFGGNPYKNNGKNGAAVKPEDGRGGSGDFKPGNNINRNEKTAATPMPQDTAVSNSYLRPGFENNPGQDKAMNNAVKPYINGNDRQSSGRGADAAGNRVKADKSLITISSVVPTVVPVVPTAVPVVPTAVPVVPTAVPVVPIDVPVVPTAVPVVPTAVPVVPIDVPVVPTVVPVVPIDVPVVPTVVPVVPTDVPVVPTDVIEGTKYNNNENQHGKHNQSRDAGSKAGGVNAAAEATGASVAEGQPIAAAAPVITSDDVNGKNNKGHVSKIRPVKSNESSAADEPARENAAATAVTPQNAGDVKSKDDTGKDDNGNTENSRDRNPDDRGNNGNNDNSGRN